MKKFILSPCGTSLLTNGADDEMRSRITTYANTTSKEEIPEVDRIVLEERLGDVKTRLMSAKNEEVQKISAELNCILLLKTSPADHHLLLATDTWLGEQTAGLIKAWLDEKQKGLSTSVWRQKDLQTKDIQAFQIALAEIVKRLGEEIPSWKEKKYQVIFNLTGGFKAVQGFLQSIAHFYADETVYIFERSSELLRIPKLPVAMNIESTVEDHFDSLRKLSLEIPMKDSGAIPKIWLLEVGSEIILNAWGELVWEQHKKTLYGKKLWDSPTDNIVFSPAFRKTIKSLEEDRKRLVNERIDQLTNYLRTKDNPKTLDFKPLKGKPKENSTHELDAWSDKDAKRMFLHKEGQNWVIDELGKGLH